MSYGQIAWLPLAGGLTLVGLIASYVAWRRRGAAAGLRGVAWSLLPLAAYLTGAIEMLWRIGSAIAGFATAFVFSPVRWAGIAVTGVAAVLFAVSGGLRRGRARKQTGGQQPGKAVATAPGASKPPAKAVQTGKGPTPADEEFGDVAEILKRHGIK
jgi:hypothetical protein